MAVHVDEIHTHLSATASGNAAADEHQTASHGHAHEQDAAGQGRPGGGEDGWRRAEARVMQLRARVAAEAFDD